MPNPFAPPNTPSEIQAQNPNRANPEIIQQSGITEQQQNEIDKQNKLIQDYSSGRATLQQFVNFNLSHIQSQNQLTHSDTSFQEYAVYLQSHGQPVPNEISQQFPEHGVSYTLFGGSPSGPTPSNPNQFFTPNIYPIASSTSGQTIYAGQPTIFPATFAFNPRFSTPNNPVYQTLIPSQATGIQSNQIDLTKQITLQSPFAQDTKSTQNLFQNTELISTPSKTDQFVFQTIPNQIDLQLLNVGKYFGEETRKQLIFGISRYPTSRPIISILNKPESKSFFKEASANIFLQGQYFLAPEYTILRSLLNLGGAFQQGNQEKAFQSIELGIGTYVGLKGLGFVNKSLQSTFPIAFKGIEIGQRSIIGGTLGGLFLANNLEIGSQVVRNIPGNQIESTLIQSSRQTGFYSSSIIGFESFDKLIQPLYYQTRNIIFSPKTTIPISELESEQVISGKTNYPKATLNAKEFKSFAEQRTPLLEKYFEPYPTAFNVSGGELPKEYPVLPGTSELAGQYVAPQNPSFTFGIPKSASQSGSSFSLLPEIPKTSGPPTANVIYGNEYEIVKVNSKEFQALNNFEAGKFYIPTNEQGIRLKSESEAILNIKTNLTQVNNRYATIEDYLGSKRGYPLGVYFDIPEYKVSNLISETKANTISIKRLGEQNSEYFKPISKPIVIQFNDNYPSKRSSQSESLISIKNNSSSLVYNTGSTGLGLSKKSLSPINYQQSRNSYTPRNPNLLSLGSNSSVISPASYSSTSSPTSKISSPGYSPPYAPPTTPYRNKKDQEYNSITKNLKRFYLGFRVQSKRRGKKFLLPGSYTEQDAFAVGTQFVRNTLAASLKLIPSNEYVEPKGITPANVNLYTSKSGFLVQKRGTRLGARTEVREIQQAKISKRQSRRIFGGIF